MRNSDFAPHEHVDFSVLPRERRTFEVSYFATSADSLESFTLYPNDTKSFSVSVERGAEESILRAMIAVSKSVSKYADALVVVPALDKIPDSLSGVPWAVLPEEGSDHLAGDELERNAPREGDGDHIEDCDAADSFSHDQDGGDVSMPDRPVRTESYGRSFLRGAARVFGGRVTPRRAAQTSEERLDAALLRFSAVVNGGSRDEA